MISLISVPIVPHFSYRINLSVNQDESFKFNPGWMLFIAAVSSKLSYLDFGEFWRLNLLNLAKILICDFPHVTTKLCNKWTRAGTALNDNQIFHNGNSFDDLRSDNGPIFVKSLSFGTTKTQ